MATVQRAADFINSIGVCTHLTYPDTSYYYTSNVISSLNYLGIDHVRDGDTGTILNASSWYYNSYTKVAKAGIKFDFDLPATQSLTVDLNFLNEIEAADPGSIYAVEGANEITNSTSFSTGGKGVAAIPSAEEAIYNAVTEDPALNGVYIYSNTFFGDSVHLAKTSISPYVTDGAVHMYFQSNAPQAGLPDISVQTVDTPGVPTVITETGYATDPVVDPASGATNVNDDVQAKYTLDLLFDDMKAGVQAVYLYELLDEKSDPDDTTSQDHYGLFNFNDTPKPAAVAIHNLTTILADNSTIASTFVTGDLNYTVSGLPQTSKLYLDGDIYGNYAGSTYLLEKSNGAFDIAIWAEPALWNSVTASEIVAPPSLTTVTLGQAYQTIEVFDPMVSSSPIQVLHNVSELKLIVTDHPIIIEVEPNGVDSDEQATPQQNAFEITGTSENQSVADNASLHPFASIEVSDSEASIGVAATVIINNNAGQATDANGILSAVGLKKTGVGTYAITATSPAALSAALESLIFTPTDHQVEPGQAVQSNLTVVLSDGSNTAYDSSTSVVAVGQDTAPTITLKNIRQTILGNQTEQPFLGANIIDPDLGAIENVTITLLNSSGDATDEDGILSGTGVLKTGVGTYTLVAQSPSAITSNLQSLVFTPALAEAGNHESVATKIGISVSDGTYTTENSQTLAIVTPVGPTFTAISNPIGSDAVAFRPLVSLNVTDTESSGAETATISFFNTNGSPTDANGTLSGISLTKTNIGTYTISAASPGAMTSTLDALLFKPTDHQVEPGQTVATQIAVTVSDGIRQRLLDETMTVTAQDTAPSISGAVAKQAIQDNQTIQAFAGVTIVDPDLGATDGVTIALINSNGNATDADGTLSGAGVVKTGVGTYILAASTPSAVTSSLEKLIFTPTLATTASGQGITTTFDLSVSDGTVTTKNIKTSVLVTPAPADQLIQSYDLATGHSSEQVSNATSTIAGINAEYLYTGIDSMLFIAPAGENWEFGGGSASTILSAVSGNNAFLSSTGGSIMIGGRGNDTFLIPDANIQDASVFDYISNFHPGDSISLAGLAGSGWTYVWNGANKNTENSTLTLLASSTMTSGIKEMVTLTGLTTNDLTSLAISHGTGSNSSDLSILYK